jgi:hypothetical protein
MKVTKRQKQSKAPFKKGDRVWFAYAGSDHETVGDHSGFGVVTHIWDFRDSTFMYDVKKDGDTEDFFSVEVDHGDTIVLESLYNSPLYQALKEDK